MERKPIYTLILEVEPHFGAKIAPVKLKLFKPKKTFKIELKAKKSDIKNGLFGFDTIPDINIVTSDYEKLKKEYKPLSKKILDEQYIPSWLSIRKDKTVTLELDWDKKSRAKEYNTIAFEEHPDFTFEPKNIKDAEKVKITCKNNKASTAQIVIKADDNLIVGALNIFYPKPKKIKLKWAIAEFNEGEIDKVRSNSVSSKLQEYFKRAFNPCLIDIVIENEKPYEINIPILETVTTNTDKDKTIKFHITKIRKHMNGEKRVISTKSDEQSFSSNLYHIGKQNNNLNNNETIVLILTNLKCYRMSEDGLPAYTNGFSLTGKGLSVMALGNTKVSPSVEIPHEIMHAICLQHTFNIASGFEILKGKTDNYMDYNNTKKHTYKWQWAKLHKSKYSNEI
ncbi:hypothetical protein [Tenacibaculum finnmarkense]|uniref:hypothetical protein n=1 Tax=Tenacibaculum finnmarkense TaxID=2781243 RepID=UPI001E37AA88|nr:hypothetical protein [Tenacibaculum finnmarkense]MCD8418338.1 hypothetical protein [Tenacibaculum finnmarkense genomovar finnmarkense]